MVNLYQILGFIYPQWRGSRSASSNYGNKPIKAILRQENHEKNSTTKTIQKKQN